MRTIGVERMPKRDNGSTTLFRALGNYRRQAVIEHVGRGEKELGELAELIGKRESAMDGNPYNSQARKRVYVSLMQSHLPKMDEWGIIEYDNSTQEIKGTWKAWACRWLIRVGKVIQ